MSNIQSITAYEILASDGFPTIKCTVLTSSGVSGSAAVSYGASAGIHEASVLTDGDPHRYLGKGVLGMCQTIEQTIAPKLIGLSVFEQKKIDALLVELDGTDQKQKLGGNTILAVSMAVARAAAKVKGVELYAYLAETFNTSPKKILPKPMVVTIEGGKHADKSTDLQEYLLTITHSDSARENIRVASEIYHTAKEVLREEGWSTNIGNEGAFAPEGITSNTLPIELLQKAIIRAGYKPRHDAWISLDAASSEFYRDTLYHFACEKRTFTPDKLLLWYEHIVQDFPIFSLEDAFAEDAWEDWPKLMHQFGASMPIVGDDLTVTNTKRLKKALDTKSINAILIKLNQAGTVSETIAACVLAREQNCMVIPSHRGGGESNDTFMVDLAVATGADFIKVGIARGERVAKYNRLMAIEDFLQITD